MNIPKHVSHAVNLAHINNVPGTGKETPVTTGLLLVPERRVTHLEFHPVPAFRVVFELSELFRDKLNILAVGELGAQKALSTHNRAIAFGALWSSPEPGGVEEVDCKTGNFRCGDGPECVAAGGLVERVGWAAAGHCIGSADGKAGLRIGPAITSSLLDVVERESESRGGKSRESDGGEEHLERMDLDWKRRWNALLRAEVRVLE